MGTNYYAGSTDGIHIGKRSAAGLYCWDCGVTLCKGGKDKIHYTSDWYDRCQVCGKEPEQEDLSESSVGRELGFNRSEHHQKTGVRSCSSFTWAVPAIRWKKIVLQTQSKLVVDEYGDKYTIEEFKMILEECPIRYTHSIGEDFS